MPVDPASPLYHYRRQLIREVAEMFRHNRQATLERVRAREIARRRSNGLVRIHVSPAPAAIH